MMRAVMLAGLILITGCSTTTDQLRGREPRAVELTKVSAREVADCIARATPGLFVPAINGEGAKLEVVWRQEPIGAVGSFDILEDATGTTVTVRTVAPIGKQLRKVAHCYP